MRRDIFRRSHRMTFEFGGLEDREPGRSFEFHPPIRIDQLRSSPCEVQQHGEHRYWPAGSAVQTPGGRMASINGPAPEGDMGLGCIVIRSKP